jgi:hypothetical protein
VSLQNIPNELRVRNNFVVWRNEIRDGEKTKVPYDAKSNGNHIRAKSNDPATWASFEEAARVADILSGNDYDGVGIMLGGSGLIGIDFDGVVDDGVPEPYVLNIISQIGTPYCEITPSGTGLRVFIKGTQLPPGNRKFSAKKKGVEKYGAEIYSGSEGGRYLTLTGERYSGEGVPEISNIDIVYFLISKFADTHFRAVWMGDASEYENDDSRVDLALLGLLVRAFSGDIDKALRFFAASVPGHREKWAEREDYRKLTINKATSGLSYGVPPAQLQKALKELNFSSSSVEKLEERAYVLGPNLGEKFGLFRLGQVSLISGSSGGGKTSLMNQLLVTQELGADFFEYKTHGYAFVLLSRDRNQDAHEETMERMHLALETIPFVRLPKNVWDTDAAQSIVDAIEKLNPLPKIVFIEGVDMLLKEMTITCTTYFSGLLEDIAQHFQIALICSIGSPKSKKDQGYPAGRDNILGSSGWGRTIDTLWWMQFTKDGDTSPQRHLTIYPRNAGAKAFTLGFVDGQLEIQPDTVEGQGGDENKRADLELTWYQQQDRLAKTDPTKRWWTIVDMEQALHLTHATADRHAKNAYVKKWIVKKRGDKQGKGAPTQYQWNASSANPLHVEESGEMAF